MVEDKIQDLNSVTCGIFQIYFYDNLFNPDENSKKEDKNQLNKRTIKNLSNERFVLADQKTNEATIKQYAKNTNRLKIVTLT